MTFLSSVPNSRRGGWPRSGGRRAIGHDRVAELTRGRLGEIPPLAVPATRASGSIQGETRPLARPVRALRPWASPAMIPEDDGLRPRRRRPPATDRGSRTMTVDASVGRQPDPFLPLPLLTPSAAQTEADRCLYCFDAPCTQACPTGIDVPSFIRRIATSNLEGSARTILAANPWGRPAAPPARSSGCVRGTPPGRAQRRLQAEARRDAERACRHGIVSPRSEA
jgi:hypothetical protein